MSKFAQGLKNFFVQSKKALIVLGSLLVMCFVCMGVANGIQHDWGNITIESGSIETTLFDDPETAVNIGYKLYIPKGVDKDHKAPAALCLHGYQNDHETSAAYALELARRGYVTLTVDLYGHGSTNAGMIERGYVNHKVTVNYGYEDDFEKQFVEVKDSSATRYKLMMNFSNEDFFSDLYSKSYNFETGLTDTEGATLRDSSMGGSAAYAWLASKEFVDNTNMVVTGHSMGTWAAWSVAAAYSGSEIEPRATALQCGELFKCIRDNDGRLAYDCDASGDYTTGDVVFNNVLLVTAKYDEFNYFRDYHDTPVTEEMIKDEQSLNFLGVSEEDAKWSTQYGNFADGTARERYYIVTNHRLTTHDHRSVSAIVDWFNQATNTTPTLKISNQTYMVKEVLVFVAMLLGIASTVAMAMALKPIPFFAPVFQSVPNRPEKIKKGKKFAKAALITILLSAATYPFMTQLGHGLLPLPEKVFKMTIGNGFIAWYLILIIAMLLLTIIPRAKNKKKGIQNDDYVDMGLARDDDKHRNKLDWGLLGKSFLVALIGVVWMYLQVILFEAIFDLDYRFIWPFFKGYSWSRFGQLLVYFPFFALFYILNNSKIFASNRVEGADEKGAKGFFKCWWKYALLMVGGTLVVILIEYIPFFLQLGPGADLLFSTTFGGPFMSLLIVFAPQVIVFSFVGTYCYRKTGNIYTGAFIIALLACWIVTGGSAMLFA